MEPWKTALAVVGSVVGAGAILWPVGIWWEVSKCEQPKYTAIRPLGSSRSWLTGKSPAELRLYAPMLVAEVTVSGTMREASSAGFRAIANFIFGGNRPAGSAPAQQQQQGGKKGEAIAMTSPVRMEIQGAAGSGSGSSEGGSRGIKKGDGTQIAMTSPVRMEMVDASGAGAGGSGTVVMSFIMPSKFTKDSLPVPKNPDVRIAELPSYTAAVLQFRGHIRGRQVVDAKAAELRSLMAAEGLVPEGDLILNQFHPPFTYGWQRVNEVAYRVKNGDSVQAAAK